MEEFIIWGYPPNGEDTGRRVLLHTKSKSMDEAKRVMGVLEEDHGCTNMRVQVHGISNVPFNFTDRILNRSK